MDINQSYYTLSNKNNGMELMFLFNIGLSRLINKLSLISNKNFRLLRRNGEIIKGGFLENCPFKPGQNYVVIKSK